MTSTTPRPPKGDVDAGTETVATPTSWATTSEILAALPAIVWEADGVDNHVTYVSPRSRDILGHDPEAWTGGPTFWEEHLHPDDRAGAMRGVMDAITTFGAAELTYRFRAADGSYRWFRDALRVVPTADGGRRLAGVMLDITGEREAQAERDLLAAAVAQASESLMITDVDARIVYVNPAFERTTGYRRDEVLGQNPRLLQSGLQAPAFYVELWRSLAAGHPWAGELVNRRKDGETYIEEVTIAPVHDDAGTITNYVAVQRDVTRERAERAARDWFAASVESASDAVYTVDLAGTFLAWNDAAERLYGWSRDEVLGHTAYEMIVEEEHASIREWIARVAEGATIGPIDAVHRGRDGRPLDLSVIASPVRDASGRVTGVATIARDVSAERRLAEERAVLEGQLRQAQKMDAIGRLAGGVAHDFNNLLTAISGYATIVAASLEGSLLEDQEQVILAAERAAELTRRLLAFSHSTPVDPRPVAVDEVLENAFRMLRRLVPENIELQVRPRAGALVLADPVEIDQLLLNLVVNAVDATPGTGLIRIATELDRSGSVVLIVSDTGSGMDEATQAHIFEPFFTTKEQGRGTGLGLATVYGIVHRAGGRIVVESTPGWGTTFRIWLPAIEGTAPVAAPAPAAGVGGTERVLLVEDSAVLRSLAARLLRSAGYEVQTAASPADVIGIDMAAVDVVVTDVIMPGMSGVEMVERFAPTHPVVYVSGYTGTIPAETLAAAPRRVLIEKPFSKAALLAGVRAVLDGRAR